MQHHTYRNVFTVEECDKFTQLVGNRDPESGKNTYGGNGGNEEFDIFEMYGKPLTGFDRLQQHDRIIRAKNPLVAQGIKGQEVGTEASNINHEFYKPLIEFMQPVVDLVKKEWDKDATVENCYGVDYNSYPAGTSLEPHSDLSNIVAIIMIKNRNLVGGNLILWDRKNHKNMTEIVKQFLGPTPIKPDLVISDLQTGDVFIYQDKLYFHAVEPVVSGVRQTSIVRWN